MKFYGVKNNVSYCYAHKIDGKITSYTYSTASIDFILSQIKKDPTGAFSTVFQD